MRMGNRRVKGFECVLTFEKMYVTTIQSQFSIWFMPAQVQIHACKADPRKHEPLDWCSNSIHVLLQSKLQLTC